MSDAGVWVKLEQASYGSAATIDAASSNYDSVQNDVEIDGSVYDIYTFTTPTTPEMTVLTAESRQAIADYEADDPDTADAEGDVNYVPEVPEDLIEYETIPASEPGLSLNVTTAGAARILVVGGGGPGGTWMNGGACGGGGGAGEMYEDDVILPMGNLQVTVGAGGFKIDQGNLNPTVSGYGSNVGPFAACGGGAGGGYAGNSCSGSGGGSGGGEGGGNSQGSDLYGTVIGRITGGNDGGYSNLTDVLRSSGGGGAGSPGLGGQARYNDKGGDGKETNITGTPQIMAAGGGGYQSPGGSDGVGGAGIWLNNGADEWASPPAVNTGSGGGAGYNNKVEPGSAGIVIVRVQVG